MYKIEILYQKVSYISNANRRMLSDHAGNPITTPNEKRERRFCGISERLTNSRTVDEYKLFQTVPVETY